MHAAALSGPARSRTTTAANNTNHGLLLRVRAYFAGRRVERRTLEELGMTTTRELADLGLSRYDVPRIAALAGRQAAEKFLSA